MGSSEGLGFRVKVLGFGVYGLGRVGGKRSLLALVSTNTSADVTKTGECENSGLKPKNHLTDTVAH